MRTRQQLLTDKELAHLEWIMFLTSSSLNCRGTDEAITGLTCFRGVSCSILGRTTGNRDLLRPHCHRVTVGRTHFQIGYDHILPNPHLLSIRDNFSISLDTK